MATQSGNYFDSDDINNWPAGFSDAQKLARIQMVEASIEEVTHDYFYANAFTLTLNGNGKDQLFLGVIPDILSISELLESEVILNTNLFSFDNDSVFRAALATAQTQSIEGITLSSTDPVEVNLVGHGFITGETARLISMEGNTPSLDGEYAVTKVDDDNLTLNGTDSSDYSGSFTSGTIVFATLAELHFLTGTPQGFFPKGTMNIKITGTYGWATCPEAIKQAAIIMCRFENDGTLYNAAGDFKSEKLGDYSYTRMDTEKYLTGILQADRKLRPYIRKKAILGAV